MYMMKSMLAAAAAFVLLGQSAGAVEVGIIGFQFSSETHARVANAAAAAAAKAKGWNVTLLNSEGSLPKHAEQFDALIAKKVDAIIIAMGKPVEADAQFKAAKDAKIPVVTVQSARARMRSSTSRPTNTRSARRPRSTCSASSATRATSSRRASTSTSPRASAQDPRLGAFGEPGREGARQVLDGPHPELAGHVRSGMQCAAACRPGQDQRHLGLVRRQAYIIDDLCRRRA